MMMCKKNLLMMGVLLSTLFFSSCLGDHDSEQNHAIPAIVTIKPIDTNSYYMQLDDSTTLWPLNSYKPAVLKKQRALIYFQETKEKVSGYDKAVRLLRMDSILTKNITLYLGEKDDALYEKNPIGLNANSIWAKRGIWIEDGYLNINFVAYFGGQRRHLLRLLQIDRSDPYILELRHHANSDPAITLQEGLVAFDLEDLPSTEGKTVPLTIKYLSFNGEKIIKLNYKSKK